MIRRLVLAALPILALLGVATPSSGQEKWVEYRSAAGGYRLEFPAPPKVETRDVQTKDGPKHMDFVQAPFGDWVFMSAYADITTTPADPQAYLDTSRDGTVASTNSTLRSSRRLTVGGVPARRFVFERPGKSVSVQQTVLSGNRIYQMVAVVPAGQENSAVIQHFIDSFALIAR